MKDFKCVCVCKCTVSLKLSESQRFLSTATTDDGGLSRSSNASIRMKSNTMSKKFMHTTCRDFINSELPFKGCFLHFISGFCSLFYFFLGIFMMFVNRPLCHFNNYARVQNEREIESSLEWKLRDLTHIWPNESFIEIWNICQLFWLVAFALKKVSFPLSRAPELPGCCPCFS